MSDFFLLADCRMKVSLCAKALGFTLLRNVGFTTMDVESFQHTALISPKTLCKNPIKVYLRSLWVSYYFILDFEFQYSSPNKCVTLVHYKVHAFWNNLGNVELLALTRADQSNCF